MKTYIICFHTLDGLLDTKAWDGPNHKPPGEIFRDCLPEMHSFGPHPEESPLKLLKRRKYVFYTRYNRPDDIVFLHYYEVTE